MDLSPIGRAVLIDREGRRLEAYRDSVGIWTIGVGHTAAAGPPLPRLGLRITAAECDAIFARDVARFVRTVAQALQKSSAEPLPQHASTHWFHSASTSARRPSCAPPSCAACARATKRARRRRC